MHNYRVCLLENWKQLKEAVDSGLINRSDFRALATNYGLSAEQVQLAENKLFDSTKQTREKSVSRDVILTQDFPTPKDPLKDTLSEREEDALVTYGASLFRGKLPEFAPNLQIPTPLDYVLGTGDVVYIDIWGHSERSYSLPVDKHGNVFVPNLGPVHMGGSMYEVALRRLKNKLTAIYAGLSEARSGGPNTFMQLSLGKLRTVSVHLVGEVRYPGAYTMPALAGMMHALYYAGGPNERGSLRRIELIREGQLVDSIDIYDYISGQFTSSSKVFLKDQDIVRVPVYINRITLQGAFKRKGYYEAQRGETLSDILAHSGGFSSDAYTSMVQVIRNEDGRKSIYSPYQEQYSTFVLQDGDVITADNVIDSFVNQVHVRGAVMRPGSYELKPDMRMADLIEQAGGVRPTAFLERAFLERRKSDSTYVNHSFHLGNLLEKDAVDFTLQNNDVLVISSRSEIQEEKWVFIIGEVNQPGKYRYKEGMRVEDLILEAKGLKYSAADTHVEVLQNTATQQKSDKISELHLLDIQQSLDANQSTSLIIKPFDYVFVRRNPNYYQPKFVMLLGEVRYPGVYALYSKNEYLSSVIARAGGFTENAYPIGASMSRVLRTALYEQRDHISALSTEHKSPLDTMSLDSMDRRKFIPVGIQLNKAVESPRSRYDLQLEDGDRVFVPRRLDAVFVRAGVLNPTAVVYNSDYSVRDYINFSGGFTENANKKNIYIRQANGIVERRKRFLVFSKWPRVEPGAEIVIPIRIKPKRSISITEGVAITSSLLTLGLLVSNLIDK